MEVEVEAEPQRQIPNLNRKVVSLRSVIEGHHTTDGSRGWDPWIRRLGSVDPEAGIMDPEAGIHGSGGWDPWIRRLGSMDPEAGTHGSGGWDPWIRASEAGLGRPRPAGRGEGARSAKRAKKSEKFA